MKLAILGLGNIGQKAFLPIYITKHDTIDWVLYSRDRQKGERLQQQHQFSKLVDNYETLLTMDLDGVMIHTPTSSHTALIEAFLKRGIHVYCDKPISENVDEVSALYALADAHNCILFAGFNRRFSPAYQAMKNVSDKNTIIVQKHRANALQETRFALFDMMSHVVDTALYLMDEPIRDISFHGTTNDGFLQHAQITLTSAGCTTIAIMNMQSGANTERVDVMSPSGHHVVENMDALAIHTPGTITMKPFGDWTTTLYKRGFETMVDAFLTSIRPGNTNPVSPESVILVHTLLHDLDQFLEKNGG